MSSRFTRREFLRWGAAGAVLAVSACAPPAGSERIWSALTAEQEAVLGAESWYATLCRECPGGCSILVRVMEGRPRKIEGNPLHPVNEGRACARGQASLQGLYDPDRLTRPAIRTGSGALEPVGWEEALEELSGRLRAVVEAGQGNRVLLLAPPARATWHWLLHEVAEALGTPHLIFYEPFSTAALRAAHARCLGMRRLPYYDLGRADLVVSFGAPLLDGGPSPVRQALDYGRLRHGGGQLICLEPRLSLTAAAADRWLPVRLGQEGAVALALARELLDRDRTALRSEELPAWREAIPRTSLADAALRAGVSERSLREVAEALAGAERPLAIGGGPALGTSDGEACMAAVLALNYLLGAVGRPGGLLPSASPLAAVPRFRRHGDGTAWAPGDGGFERLEQLGAALLEGRAEAPEVALVVDLDPLHALPAASLFRRALSRIPLLVVLSSALTETAVAAHRILPVHTPLEDGGDDVPDPAPGRAVYGLAQPVSSPLVGSRPAGDVLLRLVRGIGPETERRLPWESWAEVVEGTLRELHARFGSGDYAGFREEVRGRGVWIPPAEVPEPAGGFSLAALSSGRAEFAGNADEYPLSLVVFPHPHLGDGRLANRAWLQELGDPVTTVAWGTWVEVHPGTAASLGLEPGSRVRVESPYGSLVAPAFPYPGIRPDTVALPAGGGHAFSGRYARGRGVNPLHLVAPRIGSGGALAWNATRVRLSPAGGRARLALRSGRLGGPPHGR